MNDEETVALIAGGHTFGKTHGAGTEEHIGPDPEAAPLENQGLGWKNDLGTGKGDDTITSGLEVTWTYHPTRWDNEFFHILFSYEWELFKSPGGANQWRPKNGAGDDLVPLAHDPSQAPRAADAHLRPGAADGSGVREDLPSVLRAPRRVRRRLRPRLVQADPPRHGSDGPLPGAGGAGRGPALAGPAAGRRPRADRRRGCGGAEGADPGVRPRPSRSWCRPPGRLPRRFRGSDKRGGVNGARIRLAPQKDWEVNNPVQLAAVLETLESIQTAFNEVAGRREDGVAGRPDRAGRQRRRSSRPLAPVGSRSRCRSTRAASTRPPEQTDVESFGYLEPIADGFRSYYGKYAELPAEYLLVDKANLLTLSAPEMTVLVGGMRVLETNWDGSTGVLTERPGVLSNDFFVNLLELGNTWKPLDPGSHAFQATSDATGEATWIGSRADLVFGSNSELRASPRCTPATTRTRSSCTTSSRRGPRSPSWTGSTWADPCVRGRRPVPPLRAGRRALPQNHSPSSSANSPGANDDASTRSLHRRRPRQRQRAADASISCWTAVLRRSRWRHRTGRDSPAGMSAGVGRGNVLACHTHTSDPQRRPRRCPNRLLSDQDPDGQPRLGGPEAERNSPTTGTSCVGLISTISRASNSGPVGPSPPSRRRTADVTSAEKLPEESAAAVEAADGSDSSGRFSSPRVVPAGGVTSDLPASGTRGGMLALRWKTLAGSYVCLICCRRSNFEPYAARGPSSPDGDALLLVKPQRVGLGHLERRIEVVDVADDLVAAELVRGVRVGRQPLLDQLRP